MSTLDYLTFASYLALVIDVLFQVRQIYTTKSSQDLSLTGMSIRFAAILVIFAKFLSLSDVPLVLGQGLIAVAFGAYFTLAIYYRRLKKQQHVYSSPE